MSNLDFAGMAGTGVNRAKDRLAGNQSGLTMKERFGRGPTKGNASSNPDGNRSTRRSDRWWN